MDAALIVNVISIIVTTISIIVSSRNTQPPVPACFAECPVLSTQTLKKQAVAQDSNEWFTFLLVIIGIMGLGKLCYPYRHIMAFLFSLFWWFVLVVFFRFFKKDLRNHKGHSIIPDLLIEAVINMVGLIFLDRIPPEVYSVHFIVQKLYQPLLMGGLALIYAVLIALGILLITYACSKPQSKVSEASRKWLIKYRFLPLLPLIGVLFLAFMLLLIGSK